MTKQVLDTCALVVGRFEDLYCGICWQDGRMLNSITYCVDCQEYYCGQCLPAHIIARQDVKAAKNQLQESDTQQLTNKDLTQLQISLQNVKDRLKAVNTERIQMIKRLNEESIQIFKLIDNFRSEVAALVEDLENSMTMYVKDLENQCEDEIEAHLNTLSEAQVVLETRMKKLAKPSPVPMDRFLINTTKPCSVLGNTVLLNVTTYRAEDNAARCNVTGNKARCDDPSNKARCDDPGNKARCDDPSNKARYDDPGNKARCDDPGNKARCDDPGNKARCDDPGNKAMNENRSDKLYDTINLNIQERLLRRSTLDNVLQQQLEDFVYKINKLTANQTMDITMTVDVQRKTKTRQEDMSSPALTKSSVNNTLLPFMEQD